MSGIATKTVAITGASSGVGRATALLLAKLGANVVLGARGSDKLEALAVQIEAAGGAVAHAAIDVSRRDDVARLVALACDRFGKLDVLFSNAGIMPIGPLDDLQVDDWERMVDVNFKGVLFGIASALPVFRKQGFGHFIHTASTAGLLTKPNQAVYSATKFAVRALSDGLRQEISGKLRVTVISPGFVDTNFANTMTNPDIKARMEVARDELAMSPDMVARAVAYAIEQPEDVNVGEIVIRSTAQA